MHEGATCFLAFWTALFAWICDLDVTVSSQYLKMPVDGGSEPNKKGEKVKYY